MAKPANNTKSRTTEEKELDWEDRVLQLTVKKKTTYLYILILIIIILIIIVYIREFLR